MITINAHYAHNYHNYPQVKIQNCEIFDDLAVTATIFSIIYFVNIYSTVFPAHKWILKV